MTDKTLLKILTKRKPSIIFSVSGLIAGIYAGFMVWYALKTYIPGPLHTHLSYLAVIVLGISAFIAVYQIPDLLFANEKIEHVLPLPIDSGTVIFVLLKKVHSGLLGRISLLFQKRSGCQFRRSLLLDNVGFS